MSEVRITTPGLDKAKAVFNDYSEELQIKLAQEVNEAVHSNFSVFRNPTGYYASRVSVERNTVTDHGVVYGSWLEKGGKGFRGYHSFEKATAEVDAKAEQVAQRLLSSKYLGRIN